MEVADIIFGVASAIVGFVFKVTFGLIQKNERKSDEADQRLERAIEKVEEKFRSNDYSLFEKANDLGAKLSAMEAKIDCIKGAK